MNSQEIQQSTNDIQNESSENLNSEVSAASKNDGVVVNNFQEESQNSIHSKTNEFNDASEKHEIQDLSGVIQSKQLKEVCWYNQLGQRVCRS
jgi:hypothetical protein